MLHLLLHRLQPIHLHGRHCDVLRWQFYINQQNVEVAVTVARRLGLRAITLIASFLLGHPHLVYLLSFSFLFLFLFLFLLPSMFLNREYSLHTRLLLSPRVFILILCAHHHPTLPRLCARMASVYDVVASSTAALSARAFGLGGRGFSMVIIQYVMMSIAILLVINRFAVRLMKCKELGLDDLVILASLVRYLLLLALAGPASTDHK